MSPLFCSMLSLEESVKAMSLCAEEDDIPWDSIRDNRDLTVFTSWDPKERSEVIYSRPTTTTRRAVLHLFTGRSPAFTGD